MKWSAWRPQIPPALRVSWSIWDTLVVFLGGWIVLPFAVVLVLRLVAAFNSQAEATIRGLATGDITATFALSLINAVGAMLLVWYYLRRYGKSWAEVGWRRVDLLKAAGYMLAAFILFALLIGPLLQLVALLDPNFQPNQPQENDFLSAAGNHKVLAFLALVVLPPIVEETVFRGFIFPALAKRWGFWIGAIISSILFGFAHLQANVSIYTFVLGVLLCYLYVRLKSIWPGIGLHMLNNYLAYVALTTLR